MTSAPIKIVRGFGVLGSWLLPVMIAMLFLVVLLRYVFNIGWIGLQESVLWLHAAAFLFTAAWTLADDAHVRVDVFYHRFSRRGQATGESARYPHVAAAICRFYAVCQRALCAALVADR